MSNLGGQSANWQADFPRQVWTERFVAAGQALNAEAAVTVAEPRWPPPIQNAAAAVVVASAGHANVRRTVGLRPSRPRHRHLIDGADRWVARGSG